MRTSRRQRPIPRTPDHAPQEVIDFTPELGPVAPPHPEACPCAGCVSHRATTRRFFEHQERRARLRDVPVAPVANDDPADDFPPSWGGTGTP